ncbi:MAG: prepilin peptidase, partial [Candidatus Hydrothermarchaeaceae archaeon]
MIEELFVFLALAGAVLASITDMRSGIIPNRLTFTLIAVGIFGYLAYGLLTGDFFLFGASLKSLAVMFVAGYLFWMLGAWSAGDAKEFLFIAALVPAYPAFLYGTFNPTLAYYPFVITVFINTFLSIFPFIFIYSLYISLEKKLASRFMEPLKN